MRGDDRADGADGDFQDGVIIGGEPAADVVDADGDEDAAVRRGAGFGLVGAVFSAGERILGGGVAALFPAAEVLAEGLGIDGHRSGERQQGR